MLEAYPIISEVNPARKAALITPTILCFNVPIVSLGAVSKHPTANGTPIFDNPRALKIPIADPILIVKIKALVKSVLRKNFKMESNNSESCFINAPVLGN